MELSKESISDVFYNIASKFYTYVIPAIVIIYFLISIHNI